MQGEMAKSAKQKPTKSGARDARINVRLSADLHKKLVALAEADRRSLSNYIEILLEKHAEQNWR
jgi:predicted HicB family RNase H-like nuclease